MSLAIENKTSKQYTDELRTKKDLMISSKKETNGGDGVVFIKSSSSPPIECPIIDGGGNLYVNGCFLIYQKPDGTRIALNNTPATLLEVYKVIFRTSFTGTFDLAYSLFRGKLVVGTPLVYGPRSKRGTILITDLSNNVIWRSNQNGSTIIPGLTAYRAVGLSFLSDGDQVLKIRMQRGTTSGTGAITRVYFIYGLI